MCCVEVRAGIRAGTLGLLGALGAGCGPDTTQRAALVEVTDALGLASHAPPWPDGTYFLPEIMQGGVGLFDADADGDLDLLHVRVPPPGSQTRLISNRMYRCEGPAAAPRYAEVTAEAGLDEPGFGQGLALGDADNDGDLDLYVANYERDHYYTNDGDGSFTEATERAGLVEDGWTSTAAFCDYDADGFQDLYVVRYQRFDPGRPCHDASARQEYCGPILGAPDTLYRNRGDGSFADVSAAAGIEFPQRGARATGLGIVFTDLTKDGRPDIYVANDAQANFLWVNHGDGTFTEEGVQRGVAFDHQGRAEANMGVAVGDVNGDLALDLFVTHLWQENNRLYVGSELPVFRDFTIASGLSRHDLERTGFGCAFFDFDHDGDQDLAVANGAVHRRPPIAGSAPGFWAEYAEPNQLFENDGSARFTLVDEAAGPFARAIEVSRGLALGDLDQDGDLDLVLSNVDNTLRAYRNDAPPAGSHWLLVRALTRGRDALGAQVRVRAGGRERLGLVLAASSYGSSSDPRAHFGLGPSATVDELVVLWPDGRQERFPGGAADRVLTLRQGEGHE